MAKLNGININIGEKVRQCSSYGTCFSNHQSSCPHCGGCKYNILELTREIEKEIERQ